MKSLLRGVAGAFALASCVHLGPAKAGPEGVARAYAEALEQNRLTEAHALSAGLDEAHFRACYADEKVRSQRAAEVRSAAGGQGSGSQLRLTLENGSWRVQELEPAKPQVQEQAAEVLGRFLDAAEHDDFAAALSMLSASWRTRYSVERFKDDFTREPLAKERLQRARAALKAGAWVMAADGAQLPLGEGRAVRLARESDGYKVAALE